MENISRKEREGHKYIPGTANEVEVQHVNEHETLQMLQRYALNGKSSEFFELLLNINGDDKRRDIVLMCNMQGKENDHGTVQN
jgi:hypothetical protein|tara:strand:- start:439 stop:687 length:249 start_codon:yes stop_codon:yes gene_type:complete